MTRLSSLILFICTVFNTAALAQHRELLLTELIDEVASQGHHIVYSNALVHSHQKVVVETTDLEALRAVLPPLGLELRQQQGLWIILRSTEEAGPEPTTTGAQPPQDKLLETVIVTGTLHRFPRKEPGSSRHRYDVQALKASPSLASDASRITLRLPGISSVGISAKPRIRGGLDDELLIIQDGVELLEPFHLADYHSAFSSIDYLTIEAMDFYTGGFPSRYGNRMSGVLDIENKWEDDKYHTDIGVSRFAQFIHHRGTLGADQEDRWMLSLRRGDLSDLADYIETQSGRPRYLDVSSRLSLALSERHQLSAGASYAEDDILFRGEDERAVSRVDNTYLWTALEMRPTQKLRGSFTLSWLDFKRTKGLSSFEEEAKGGFLDHRQKIERIALRNDWSRIRGDASYEFGWQAEYSSGNYQHTSDIDRGILADILGTERTVVREIDVRPDGLSGGTYVQAQWPVAADIVIQPSLRMDVQDYYLERNADVQWSPRLGLEWMLTPFTSMQISAGRFQQPEGVQELQVLDGLSRFFKAQSSDQIVVGLKWQKEAFEISAEGYYKNYRRLKDRFENTFNPFVLLPEMEPDRVDLRPDKARSQGVDVDVAMDFSPQLRSHARYSYMDARDRIEGRWVDRRWSQRHTVNTGLSWQRDGLTLAAAATWHSGWRSTLLPAFVAEDAQVPVSSVYNNTELRDYLSLDLSARYALDIGRTGLEVFVDISNAGDRKNQAGIDFDVEEVEGGYELFEDGEVLLGRVVSFGAIISF